MDVLERSRAHPTADQVYDEARKLMPHISRGTVYRNLKVLSENGDISELDVSGTTTRYEGRKERHYHFRCRRCGRLFDLDEPVDYDLDRRVAERTGFTVVCHHLEFRGLCGDCRPEPAADKRNNESKEGGVH